MIRLTKIAACSALLILVAGAAEAVEIPEHLVAVKEQCKKSWRDPMTAIAACDIYIKEGPKEHKALALLARGQAYGSLKDWENAFADFDAAVKAAPKFAMAYNNRASIHRELGRFKQALADNDRAIALGGETPLFVKNKGYTLQAISEGKWSGPKN